MNDVEDLQGRNFAYEAVSEASRSISLGTDDVFSKKVQLGA